MIFEALNTLDYVIIVITFLVAIRGAMKGFIEIVSSFMGYILAFPIAFAFTRLLSDLLAGFGIPLFISAFLSFVAIYLLGFLVVTFFGDIIESIGTMLNLNFLNAILGFALALVVSICLEAVIVYLLTLSPSFDVTNLVDSSFIYKKILLPIFDLASSIFFKGQV